MGMRAVEIAVGIAVGITRAVAIAVGDLAGFIYLLSMALCSCGGKTSLW